MAMNPLRFVTRRRNGESGAAAIEFAFVLPILLLLIFGMVDFARGFNAHVSLSGAAREGARELALETGNHETATIEAAPSLTGVTVTTPTSCDTDTKATLHAHYTFEFVTPISALMTLFGGGLSANTIDLTGIGVMRCGG